MLCGMAWVYFYHSDCSREMCYFFVSAVVLFGYERYVSGCQRTLYLDTVEIIGLNFEREAHLPSHSLLHLSL